MTNDVSATCDNLRTSTSEITFISPKEFDRSGDLRSSEIPMTPPGNSRRSHQSHTTFTYLDSFRFWKAHKINFHYLTK